MRMLERALVFVLVAMLMPAVAGASGKATTSPTQAALEQGLKFYRVGNFAAAIAPLETAAAGSGRDSFLAQFYLARLYGDNSHPMTDHAKAYMLHQRIADANADIDPDDDQRAPFVAKSLVALAGYLRHGVAEIGLRPDLERAAHYLHHAATFFADEDAQFELAKLFLTGDGIAPDVRRAVHWFSVLTQRGHPGAQAFFADMHFRGKHVTASPERALALATLAVEAAPGTERIWIEDIYQRIYCGVTEGQRKEARQVVAEWRRKYGRDAEPEAGPGLWPTATRTCDDGRIVPVPGPRRGGGDAGLPIANGELAVSRPEANAASAVAPVGNANAAPTLLDVGNRAP
jgi:hypothetical protein